MKYLTRLSFALRRKKVERAVALRGIIRKVRRIFCRKLVLVEVGLAALRS